DSRVHIVNTAKADLRGIARLARALTTGKLPVHDLRAQLGRTSLEPATPGAPAGLTRQLVRFGVVGLLSTVAYLILFLLLRALPSPCRSAIGHPAILRTPIPRDVLLRQRRLTRTEDSARRA
ncbi:MAG: hypothetical protein WCC65_08865, partial [Pseudonocardiaceae bacterium]